MVASCLSTFSVLVLRRHFLAAQNQLVPAHILKMLDCLAKVFLNTRLFVPLHAKA